MPSIGDIAGDPNLSARLREAEQRLRDQYDIPGGADAWITDDGARQDLVRVCLDEGQKIVAECLSDRIHEDDAFARLIQRQIDGLLASWPGYDLAAVLAIAMRESLGSLLSPGPGRVNTYNLGGLNYFGGALRYYRDMAPDGYGDNWEEGPEVVDRQGALIPRNELFIAYALRLRHARQQLLNLVDALNREGFSLDLCDANPDTLRFLTMLAFGGRAGARYTDPTGRRSLADPDVFGLRTVLTWMSHRIERREAISINDVLMDRSLRGYHRTRAAISSMGVAKMIDEEILPWREVDECLTGNWLVDNLSINAFYSSAASTVAANSDGTTGEHHIGIWHSRLMRERFDDFTQIYSFPNGPAMHVIRNGESSGGFTQVSADQVCFCNPGNTISISGQLMMDGISVPAEINEQFVVLTRPLDGAVTTYACSADTVEFLPTPSFPARIRMFRR